MRRHIDEFIIDTPISDGQRASTHCACLAPITRGGAAMSFEQQLISWRRELHQYPELSLQEVATTARIRDWLQSGGLLCCPTI
jgi:hypothetical protein